MPGETTRLQLTARLLPEHVRTTVPACRSAVGSRSADGAVQPPPRGPSAWTRNTSPEGPPERATTPLWTVHIGVRKTGSKALQRFLLSRSQKAAADVCFPEPGRQGAWHEPIDTALRDGNDDLLAQAVARANACRCPRAILSAESFHSLPTEAIQLMRRHLGTAQIIIFIRRQDRAINSLLNQYAKAHRVGYEDVVQFRADALSPLPEFNYAAILAEWEANFGRDCVVPLIYSKSVDVVEAFCDAAGLPPETSPVADNPNPALSEAGYEAFLAAKKSVREPADLPRLVDELSVRLNHEFFDTRGQEAPWLFDESERARIMAHYETDNERVRARWFPDRSALFPDG